MPTLNSFVLLLVQFYIVPLKTTKQKCHYLISIMRNSVSKYFNLSYRNDPKFSDRYARADSADPDQATLFAIPSASFGLVTLWQSHIVQILEWLQQIFWMFEYLGNLGYIQLLFITWAITYTKAFVLHACPQLWHMSHVMRFWHFLSSINSFFKRVCADIQQG